MSRNLSTAEAARLLGLREPQIRELVRAGLCRPARHGRRYAFSFQDLVVLRAAKSLLDRRVPAARVRRALAALVEQLPPERPLSGVRVQADGREVAVCDGGAAWQPATGQVLFTFEVDALVRELETLRKERAARALAGDDRWQARSELERALELEDVDAEAAAIAYRRAVALDPALSDAWVNLGRLAHEGGEPAEAARLYRRALERCPDDPVIHYNLALAVEETEDPAAAVPHYERALAIDPDFADAHYNLAALCEQVDRQSDALRHYREYKKLCDG